MGSCRPLFWKRRFEPHVIVTSVRWYCRFSLSLRDLEELMAERGLAVDHTTIWRWVQRYGPEVLRWLQGEVKRKSSTWHMDETFIRIAGKQMYPVSRGGQPRPDGGFLPVGDTRSRSSQALPEKGDGQSGQPGATRVCPRWVAELSSGDSRVAGRRSRTAALSAANASIL